MKVLLTLYGDEALRGVDSPEDIARTMQAWGEFGEAAAAAGVLLQRRPDRRRASP